MKHKNGIGVFLHDAAKAVGIGLAASAGVFALSFALGAVCGGFSAAAGLETARRALLIVGALCLFVSAAALIAADKAASLAEDPQWKKHFARLGLFGVLFFAAVGILLVAGLLDSALFYAMR